MTIDAPQALVQAKIREWHDVHSGWLVISPAEITVYRRKFIRGMERAANFETSRLRAAEPDSVGKSVVLTFDGQLGQSTCETIAFYDGKAVQTTVAVLSDLLKAAEEKKRHREEEARRLRREQQERERQTREAFAADVWETSEILWLMARANYAMVNAVIVGDWDETKQQYSTIWQQADRLNKGHNIELTIALKELDQDVSSKNGEEVIRKASSFLKSLSGQVLRTDALWVKWQDQKDMLSGMSPNYDQLPHFLLFSASYFEALLSSQLEDWTGVNNGLSMLRPTGTVLQRCFNIDLDRSLDVAVSAATERDRDSYDGIAKCMESAILDSLKARQFKFEQLVIQREGEHDGSVPE